VTSDGLSKEFAQSLAASPPRVAPSSVGVSERMSRARRKDTAPERALRSELHRRGLRFRIHRPVSFDRRRKVDIAFPSAQVAVFVDGCFWHACPEHATYPKANAEFWRTKLARNQERDQETNARLRSSGWEVLRVWEHEDPALAAERIEAAVRDRLREGAGAAHG
jgi:DNA mismatch endonuclease, patch repair protein